MYKSYRFITRRTQYLQALITYIYIFIILYYTVSRREKISHKKSRRLFKTADAMDNGAAQ